MTKKQSNLNVSFYLNLFSFKLIANCFYYSDKYTLIFNLKSLCVMEHIKTIGWLNHVVWLMNVTKDFLSCLIKYIKQTLNVCLKKGWATYDPNAKPMARQLFLLVTVFYLCNSNII